MKCRVVVEYDLETKSYAAYRPELPGCYSASDTEEEALEDVKEAISLYLEPTPVKPGPGRSVFEVEVPARWPGSYLAITPLSLRQFRNCKPCQHPLSLMCRVVGCLSGMNLVQHLSGGAEQLYG